MSAPEKTQIDQIAEFNWGTEVPTISCTTTFDAWTSHRFSLINLRQNCERLVAIFKLAQDKMTVLDNGEKNIPVLVRKGELYLESVVGAFFKNQRKKESLITAFNELNTLKVQLQILSSSRFNEISFQFANDERILKISGHLWNFLTNTFRYFKNVEETGMLESQSGVFDFSELDLDFLTYESFNLFLEIFSEAKDDLDKKDYVAIFKMLTFFCPFSLPPFVWRVLINEERKLIPFILRKEVLNSVERSDLSEVDCSISSILHVLKYCNNLSLLLLRGNPLVALLNQPKLQTERVMKALANGANQMTYLEIDDRDLKRFYIQYVKSNFSAVLQDQASSALLAQFINVKQIRLLNTTLVINDLDRILRLFPHLELLDLTGAIFFQGAGEEFQELPVCENLKYLYLNSIVFESHDHQEYMEKFLKEIFPNLLYVDLKNIQYRWLISYEDPLEPAKLSLSTFKALPRTLVGLDMRYGSGLNGSDFSLLPNVSSLYMGCAKPKGRIYKHSYYGNSDLAKLPESLQFLYIEKDQLLTTGCFKYIPRGIKTLTFINHNRFSDGSFLVSDLEDLPPDLEYLEIDGVDFKELNTEVKADLEVLKKYIPESVHTFIYNPKAEEK